MKDDKLSHALLCLFEQGRDPMFITNERGYLSHVNPAFLHLYGYKAEDVIGKPLSFLLQKPLHDVIFYKKILRQLFEQGSWVGEVNVVAENGEIITVWTQMIQADVGFSAIQVDLRERDKITRKMEGLSRLQSVATLAGGVAHEFNNILGGIQGHLYLFKRHLAEDQEKEHARLTRIDGLMRRATSLVQNLLSFSRQKPTAMREIALLPLLEETVEVAKKSMDKMIQIRLSSRDRGLIVFADAVILKQHVFELISNAERALLQQRKKTGYDYSSQEDQINIELGMTGDGKFAEIFVRDNGLGMQDATLRHCLDPFFTTEPVGEGTGLGLSSVAAYAQQIKGSIEVESVLGEYTSICIRLPLSSEMVSQEIKNGLVLLVDDDDDLRQSMEEILNCHGYDVMTANNGVEGLDLWRKHGQKLDAIIMDIIMPNMDGIEVAREIRKEDENIPICLTTGYSYQSIPSSLHVNLMRKPLDPSLLAEYLACNID